MTAGRPIRILVVDDSAVMRSLLRAVATADAGLLVVGTAADGASALITMGVLNPDVVLLDVEMPVMNGLVTLREMRRRGHRMPVIMCSSLTQRGARVTLDALAGGASDYVAKPAGQANREAAVRALSHELLPKIHALAGGQRGAQAGPGTAAVGAVIPGLARPVLLPAMPPTRVQAAAGRPAVLAIGVSTGGPAALETVLPVLPGDFPLPVLIVQHMPELFTRLFAERLNGRCRLRVREAQEGEPVRPGTIWIARGNWHMEVAAGVRSGSGATLHLSQGPAENHCRPAVDVLFRSVAAVYGAGALALVLTGMGSDGLVGCREIRRKGGGVLAQDEESSTVWGMPGAVAQAGLAQRVVALNEVALEILRLVSRTHSEAAELRETMV